MRRLAVALVALSPVAACSGSDAEGPVRLVTYSSFPSEGTGVNDALAAFTADTGIEVEIVVAGDTGAMVAKAALTAGNPEGDVMWGSTTRSCRAPWRPECSRRTAPPLST